MGRVLVELKKYLGSRWKIDTAQLDRVTKYLGTERERQRVEKAKERFSDIVNKRQSRRRFKPSSWTCVFIDISKSSKKVFVLKIWTGDGRERRWKKDLI